jgi:glutamate racemase
MIGIFDSGLGGLTVLKVLAEKFPQESFCYLGDIARLPYGNKSPETIKKYGNQILKFLKEQDVKALIIACNSASTVFLEEKEFEGIPLLNVILPGARAALEKSQDKKIAILGTSATINSHAYRDTILAQEPTAQILEMACPLFVPLAEEGIVNDPITQLVVKRYTREILEKKFKTVILGCTHYPIIKEDLKEVLGSDVTLIESGTVLAQELQKLYDQKILIPDQRTPRFIRICITDVTDHFEKLARSLMYPEQIKDLEKVIL